MTRRLLIVLHVFIGVMAVGGFVYGVGGAEDVPVEWLESTPFPDYMIPSIILLVSVGLVNLAVAVAQWMRRPSERAADLLSLAAGAVLMGWIVVQVAMIGYVSWMQPFSFVYGIVLAVVAVVALRRGSEERA